MSVIPPNQFVMSKLKYLIINKMKNDEDKMKETLEILGPFTTFRLFAELKHLNAGGDVVFTDEMIEEMINETIQGSDDCDKALFMMTRLKKMIVAQYTTEPYTLRLVLQSKFDTEEKYSDIFLDEIPLNVKGLKSEPLTESN